MPTTPKKRSSYSVLPDFEQMAQQLRGTLKSLEERAIGRTRDLETAAQVSQEVAKTLNLDELLPRLVNLTKSRFKLYHAQVYILDEARSVLVLEAGAGKVGKMQKKLRHSIQLSTPRSLVARAARIGETTVANDVLHEDGFMPNPLLPDTRSEMAVPMISGQKVVGILDVQSDQIDRFSEDDIHVLSTLAGQVAVAVENARAFEQVHEAQAEAEITLYRLSRQNRFSASVSEFATTLLNQGVMGLTDAIAPLAQTVGASRVYLFANFMGEDGSLAARQTHEWAEKGIAPAGERRISYDTMLPHWKEPLLTGKPVSASRSKTSSPELEMMQSLDIQSLLLIPISTGEKVSGFLGLDDCLNEHLWEQAEIELLQTAGTSIAYALTSGQLLEQTQSALSRVQILYSASLSLLMAHDFEDLLHAFVDPIFEKKPCQANLFYVINDEAGQPEWIELVATLQPFPEDQMSKIKPGRYPISDVPMASMLASKPGPIVNIPDISKAHSLVDERARQTYQVAGIQSTAVIPLTSSKRQWIGIVTFNWPRQNQLSAEDIELYNVLAPELSTALENRQLVAQSAEQVQLLRTIIDTSPDWIYAKDKDYRYVVANEAIAKFYGRRTPAEMIGLTDYDLGTPTYLIEGDSEKGIRGFRTDDRAVVEGGQTVFNPNNIVNYADGTLHILETTKVPMRDAKDNIIGVLALSRDVTQRTAKRKQQEAAYALAQRLTTVLDPDELLSETVNRIAEAFGYYHVHIYLYDPTRQTLSVREGLGEVGALLKEAGHNIPLQSERSLVAEAARTYSPVVVQDVSENPQHLPNPLLPDTLSEVAIPLFVGEEILGVLDAQHNIAGHFDEEAIATLQIIANQLSVALSNARLFEEARRRANEMATVAEIGTQASTNLNLTQLLQNVCELGKERLHLYHAHIYLLDSRQLTLKLTAGAGLAGQMMVQGGHAIPLNYEHSLVARTARTGQPAIVNDVTAEPHFLPNPLLPETKSEMTIPITLGMEIIGVLDVQDNKQNRFGEIDKSIHLTLANQIAVAISNARLFEETQKALNDIEVLYMGSNKLVHASALEEVLHALATSSQLHQFEHTAMGFFDTAWTEAQTPTSLSIAAVWQRNNDEEPPMPVGSTYSLDKFTVIQNFRGSEPFIVEDIFTDNRIDESSREILRKRSSLIVFPVEAGDALLGVIISQTNDPSLLKEDTIRQIQVLSEQASAVIHNIRLLKEAQATAEQLRGLDKLKSEFLASMSHELRTPLNSIIGYSELMIDGIGDQIDPMSLEDLKSIHSSGLYLVALINDILDLAKIEAGRLELNKGEVIFDHLAPEILEAARVLLQEKPGLQLILDIDKDTPTIHADALRLRQIVWNLVSNAIKFTSEGHIRLFCRPEENWVYIGVEDTGMGIPPEYHQIIFEQFRQVDGSSTRKAGGSGLGLAITRQLVRLHGGDLWVESEVGKGSTFTLKLPSSPELTQKSSDEADSSNADQNLAVRSTEAVGD